MLVHSQLQHSVVLSPCPLHGLASQFILFVIPNGVCFVIDASDILHISVNQSNSQK